MEWSLREELMAEVDDVWSEAIRHLPLDNGLQDLARVRVDFAACLRTGDRDAEGVSFGRGNNARAGVMADGGQLRVDRIAYPDLALRKGDKLVALERDGQPAFEVQAVDDRSHLRLICELGDVT